MGTLGSGGSQVPLQDTMQAGMISDRSQKGGWWKTPPRACDCPGEKLQERIMGMGANEVPGPGKRVLRKAAEIGPGEW